MNEIDKLVQGTIEDIRDTKKSLKKGRNIYVRITNKDSNVTLDFADLLREELPIGLTEKFCEKIVDRYYPKGIMEAIKDLMEKSIEGKEGIIMVENEIELRREPSLLELAQILSEHVKRKEIRANKEKKE